MSSKVVYKVPPKAKNIARLIKKLVPRPSILPSASCTHYALRWEAPSGLCCPMGLLPMAASLVPVMPSQIQNCCKRKIQIDEVAEFYAWWDSIDDAKAAVDAVWGPA